MAPRASALNWLAAQVRILTKQEKAIQALKTIQQEQNVLQENKVTNATEDVKFKDRGITKVSAQMPETIQQNTIHNQTTQRLNDVEQALTKLVPIVQDLMSHVQLIQQQRTTQQPVDQQTGQSTQLAGSRAHHDKHESGKPSREDAVATQSHGGDDQQNVKQYSRRCEQHMQGAGDYKKHMQGSGDYKKRTQGGTGQSTQDLAGSRVHHDKHESGKSSRDDAAATQSHGGDDQQNMKQNGGSYRQHMQGASEYKEAAHMPKITQHKRITQQSLEPHRDELSGNAYYSRRDFSHLPEGPFMGHTFLGYDPCDGPVWQHPDGDLVKIEPLPDGGPIRDEHLPAMFVAAMAEGHIVPL